MCATSTESSPKNQADKPNRAGKRWLKKLKKESPNLSNTSILLKVVNTETNVHLMATRISYDNLDDVIQTLQRAMPMLRVLSKTQVWEQLTFPLEINGVKIEHRK
jgi:hypothetical protein